VTTRGFLAGLFVAATGAAAVELPAADDAPAGAGGTDCARRAPEQPLNIKLNTGKFTRGNRIPWNYQLFSSSKVNF
jgi:hypothetical protein